MAKLVAAAQDNHFILPCAPAQQLMGGRWRVQQLLLRIAAFCPRLSDACAPR
jgi:hypothetical protein